MSLKESDLNIVEPDDFDYDFRESILHISIPKMRGKLSKIECVIINNRKLYLARLRKR